MRHFWRSERRCQANEQKNTTKRILFRFLPNDLRPYDIEKSVSYWSTLSESALERGNRITFKCRRTKSFRSRLGWCEMRGDSVCRELRLPSLFCGFYCFGLVRVHPYGSIRTSAADRYFFNRKFGNRVQYTLADGKGVTGGVRRSARIKSSHTHTPAIFVQRKRNTRTTEEISGDKWTTSDEEHDDNDEFRHGRCDENEGCELALAAVAAYWNSFGVTEPVR